MSGPATTAADFYGDFSGSSSVQEFDNPYDALLVASENEARRIQDRYSTHRFARNAQQKQKLLDASSSGISVDPVLLKLENPTIEPGYADPRNCLVFWARPPEKVKQLIGVVQKKLKAVAPSLWLMPLPDLHMTTLEMTHSRTPQEIQDLVEIMQPHIPEITDYTFNHRARLIKPMIGFDAAALALSFVPAAGEALSKGRTAQDDEFTYHHLRRDVYALASKIGVPVDSRYVVPSSHLTVARFLYPEDFMNEEKRLDQDKWKSFISLIEETNAWLQEEYWPKPGQDRVKDGGEWIVGEEKGLDNRRGTLWYGGGTSIRLGKGF